MSGKRKTGVADWLTGRLKDLVLRRGRRETNISNSDSELAVPLRRPSPSTVASVRYHSTQEQRAASQVGVKKGPLKSAKDCDQNEKVAAVKVRPPDRVLTENFQCGLERYGEERGRNRVCQSKELVREPVAIGKTSEKTEGSFPIDMEISSRTPSKISEACCDKTKQRTLNSRKVSEGTHKPPDDKYTERSSVKGILKTKRKPASDIYSQQKDAQKRLTTHSRRSSDKVVPAASQVTRSSNVAGSGSSTSKDTERAASSQTQRISAKDCNQSEKVAAVKVRSPDRFFAGNFQYGLEGCGKEGGVRQRKRLVREPSFEVATGKTVEKTKEPPSTIPKACRAKNKERTVNSKKLSERTHKLPDDKYTDRSSVKGILKTAKQKPASCNHLQQNDTQKRLTTHSRRSPDHEAVPIAASQVTRFDQPHRNSPRPLREKLPICEHQEIIVQYIAEHQVTCIQGETGCGKSSMVPQFVLEYYEKNSPSNVKHLPPNAAEEYQANIVVTQPRRLAAKTLARRVASDLGEEVGTTVGYAIARDSKRSSDTRITFVTTGYLLQLLVSKPQSFQRYTHVILDEIHERQIDSDLLSLVIKLCLTQQSKTKIIVMSATLQGRLFTEYFTESVDTPLSATVIPEPIFVGARRFPVQEVYLERFLSMSELLPSLDAREIKSIVKAWISFSASSPADVTSAVLRSIRAVNHPDLLRDKDVSPAGIQTSFRKQRAKGLYPQIQDGLLEVGEKLIMTFAKPGETTLVFLPGMADIQEMFEKLEPYEMNPGKKLKIRLFVLHSQIPNDEQEAAFKDPPADAAHVILATNIAESSLTLPKVRIVIDYGLRKHCVYNPARQMSSIQDTWISRASALQRTGRTGRVFEGSVFRMYTAHFYNKVLGEFDPPEMETSPLDKLVLRTKWIGQNIAPDEPVRQLLSQAVQPPSLEQLEAAIERLADVGALTGNSEESAVTLIGHAALRLPLDLLQCRLVVYGIIMGCPCDAIVMAASMTLRQEPFSLPLRMIMKDPRTYLASLKRSFTSRIQFDGGLYSEPIMMRNLFMAWLQKVSQSGSQDTGLTHNAESSLEGSGRHQDPLARRAARVNAIRKRFCIENSLHYKRFKEFENSVAEVASRVISFVSKDSKGFREVTNLMRILCTDEDDDVTLYFAVDDINGQARSSHCASAPTKPAPTQWFRKDSTIVKALLVASFSPTFIQGTCFDETKQSGEQMVNKCERTAAAMEKNGFNPKTSVALNNILQGNPELKGDLKMVNEIVAIACEPQRTDFGGTHDRIFIEFSYDCSMHQDKTLLHDVPFKAHLLSQFGEGRNKFAVPLPQDTHAYKVCERDQLEFYQPIQPYRLNWVHITQRRKEIESHSLQAFMKNWRNPLGFACDTRGRRVKHYAVAAGIERDARRCRVQWVTILPSEDDGFLAKIMMLAFISQNYKVEFTWSRESPKIITEVKLSGMSLQFNQQYPLTVDTLSKINKVRAAFSKIFNSCSDGRSKISDGEVSRALKQLFESCRSPEALTSTHTVAAPYGIHQTTTVSPFRKTSSKATEESPFTILEPFLTTDTAALTM